MALLLAFAIVLVPVAILAALAGAGAASRHATSMAETPDEDPRGRGDLDGSWTCPRCGGDVVTPGLCGDCIAEGRD